MILELKLERLVAPVILTERLFPLHAEVASRQSADGMLKTLARSRKAEDMLPIRIAGTVDNNDRGADDLLVVVKKEGCPG